MFPTPPLKEMFCTGLPSLQELRSLYLKYENIRSNTENRIFLGMTTSQGSFRGTEHSRDNWPHWTLRQELQNTSRVCSQEKEEQYRDLHFPSSMPAKPLKYFSKSGKKEKPTHMYTVNKHNQNNSEKDRRSSERKLKDTFFLISMIKCEERWVYCFMCALSIYRGTPTQPSRFCCPGTKRCRRTMWIVIVSKRERPSWEWKRVLEARKRSKQ